MSAFQNYEIEYLGGHPDWPKSTNIYFQVKPENKNIMLQERGFLSLNRRLIIDAEEITAIDLDDKKSRSVGKTAAGAIVGGMLTGGIGLIAGAAIGATTKNLSNIYITIDYDGRLFKVIFKTGKYTNQIYSEICGLFSA